MTIRLFDERSLVLIRVTMLCKALRRQRSAALRTEMPLGTGKGNERHRLQGHHERAKMKSKMYICCRYRSRC